MYKNSISSNKLWAVLLSAILVIASMPLFAISASAVEGLGVPTNIEWQSGASATATWDNVNNANYYLVKLYVKHGNTQIGNAQTQTSDTSVDLQQEINKVIEDASFEYTDVKIAFSVAAQKIDQGVVTESGEMSSISSYIDYHVGSGLTQQCNPPTNLSLNSDLNLSFDKVTGARTYYIEADISSNTKTITGVLYNYEIGSNKVTGCLYECVRENCNLNGLSGQQIQVKFRAKAEGEPYMDYVDSEYSAYSNIVSMTAPELIPYDKITGATLNSSCLATFNNQENARDYQFRIILSGGNENRSFEVSYHSNGVPFELSNIINAKIVEYNLTGIETSVKFAVRRCDNDGIHCLGEYSEYSNIIKITSSGKTKLGTATGLTWDSNTMRFMWSVVDNAERYNVKLKFKYNDAGQVKYLTDTIILSATDIYSYEISDTTFTADLTSKMKEVYEKLGLIGKKSELAFCVQAALFYTSGYFENGDDSEYSDYHPYSYDGKKQITVPANPQINPSTMECSWGESEYAIMYDVQFKFIDNNNEYISDYSSGYFIENSEQISTRDGKVYLNDIEGIKYAYNRFPFEGSEVRFSFRVKGEYPKGLSEDYIDSDYSDWSEAVNYSPEIINVESINLSPENLVVAVDSTIAVGKTIEPYDAYYNTIDWVIEDTSVASVDAYGNVTGKKSGKTTLTAKIGSISDQISVITYSAASNESNQTTKLALIDALKGAVDSLANYSDASGTDITNVNKAVLEIQNGAVEGETFYVDINLKTNSNPYYESLVSQIESLYGEREFVTGYDVVINCYYTDKQGSDHKLFNITELKQNIEFELEGDSGLPAIEEGKTRLYEVYRMHDGNLEKVSFEQDKKGNFVVLSNRFSDFILVYYDTDSLDEMKINAKNNLKAGFKLEDYRVEEQKTITSLLESAYKEIDASKTKELIDAIVSTYLTKLNAVKTLEQIEESDNPPTDSGGGTSEGGNSGLVIAALAGVAVVGGIAAIAIIGGMGNSRPSDTPADNPTDKPSVDPVVDPTELIYTLAVRSNPSTGYYWEMTDETKDAELVDSTFTSDNPVLVGAPGINRFNFKISNADTCYFRIVEMDARTQLPTGRYVDSTMLTGKDDPIEPANFISSVKLTQKKLTANKNGKIKVAFAEPEIDGVVSYQIYRATDKNFKKNVKKYTTKKTSYTDSKKLKKGTKYYYKVRAKIQMADGTVVYTKWSNVRYATCKKTVK